MMMDQSRHAPPAVGCSRGCRHSWPVGAGAGTAASTSCCCPRKASPSFFVHLELLVHHLQDIGKGDQGHDADVPTFRAGLLTASSPLRPGLPCSSGPPGPPSRGRSRPSAPATASRPGRGRSALHGVKFCAVNGGAAASPAGAAALPQRTAETSRTLAASHQRNTTDRIVSSTSLKHQGAKPTEQHTTVRSAIQGSIVYRGDRRATFIACTGEAPGSMSGSALPIAGSRAYHGSDGAGVRNPVKESTIMGKRVRQQEADVPVGGKLGAREYEKEPREAARRTGQTAGMGGRQGGSRFSSRL